MGMESGVIQLNYKYQINRKLKTTLSNTMNTMWTHLKSLKNKFINVLKYWICIFFICLQWLETAMGYKNSTVASHPIMH